MCCYGGADAAGGEALSDEMIRKCSLHTHGGGCVQRRLAHPSGGGADQPAHPRGGALCLSLGVGLELGSGCLSRGTAAE